MKPIYLTIIFVSLTLLSRGQYWQQQVDHQISVTLNDQEKTLTGFEKIFYKNNSPDTLRYIWFHLWPNAYKNDRTPFSDQLLLNGNTSFYFAPKEKRGYINQLSFKVNGTTAQTEDHPEYIDVLKLILPQLLLPGMEISITTPFSVKLPFNFSRGGYDGETFQCTQWYPKPATYDKDGWHAMSYLDQGEFYNEFGNYDVTITLPENYVVAATGELQDAEEKQWLRERSNYSWTPIVTKIPASPKTKTPAKKTTQLFPVSSARTKTIRYTATKVHDFAWFADKRFQVNYDTCLLASGKQVEVFTFTPKPLFDNWEKSFQNTKEALRFYSTEVGEYPYPALSIVHGPESFGGGMEYPTITLLSPTSNLTELDILTAHEVGHNWFQGMLASNERDHPWMDEGVNSFFEKKYAEQKYGSQPAPEYLYLQTLIKRKTDQPIETRSQDFSSTNYNLVAYEKTAQWLRSIESMLGEREFAEMMQAYFQKYRFKHPQPEDFLKHLSAYKGSPSIGELQAQLSKKGEVKRDSVHSFQMLSPFSRTSINTYLTQGSNSVLFLSPLFGYNYYDHLMIGGLITNYQLPPTNFSYFFTPFYATGSKQLTGTSRLNISHVSDGFIRKADLFVNASHFSRDDFRDSADRRLIMNFTKLVPGFRFTFKTKNALSQQRTSLQFKTFLLREESLRIRRDSTIVPGGVGYFLQYETPATERYLNQLLFTHRNYRTLYPYSLQLQVEQAKDFLRPAATFNYFFNYKEGGLNFRLFAGKFIYLHGKTIRKQFANDRYHLNMSGPNGDEDYTYSDYFIGRNEFDGVLSQQMMVRDGAFKVRTDLLSSKVGKTDDWLMAINLTSSLPKKINPLSVLPVKIPLKIFMDIGTYSDAWRRDSELDRILYDIGFHLPLFHETINIYLPIVYSKVFSDYYKSTIVKNRFLKTITFSIKLQPRFLEKINYDLEF